MFRQHSVRRAADVQYLEKKKMRCLCRYRIIYHRIFFSVPQKKKKKRIKREKHNNYYDKNNRMKTYYVIIGPWLLYFPSCSSNPNYFLFLFF